MIGQSSEKATRQKDYGSMGDYQKKNHQKNKTN